MGITRKGERICAEVVLNVTRISWKRSRNDIAMAVIEISQDEFTRNLPCEDQVKMAGMFFDMCMR